MNKQKGFTIIELIVVIAIIAVLAAIVMVNVTKYITQGKDASIKGNMSSMTTIAAAFYDNHTSSYNAIETADPAFAAGITAIDGANGANNVIAHSITNGFCVQSQLNDGSTWCVDSTGYKGATNNCDVVLATCQ